MTIAPLRGLLAALSFVLPLALLAPAAAAIDPSYSGSWYNPPESGSGFNLEIFEDRNALLFWYTYDDNGDAVWLYSEGAIEGERIQFLTYYAHGMRFSDLDNADKRNEPWGTVTMEFADCNNATITYQSTLAGFDHSPVGARTHPVQRLVNIDTLPCRTPVQGYWEGRHYDPSLNSGSGGNADLGALLLGDGRAYFASRASGETWIGSYRVEGGQVVVDYEVCENNQAPCTAASAAGSFRSKDYWGGVVSPDPSGMRVLRLAYRPSHDREQFTSALAGQWVLVQDDGSGLQFVINAAGYVEASDATGCEWEGWIAKIDPAFNVYSYTEEPSICRDEQWEGVVANGDLNGPGESDLLQFFIDTGDSATSFRVRRQP